MDELQKENILPNELFEQAPQAVALISADHRVVRVNREFTQLFGYGPDEAVGKDLKALIVPNDPEELQKFHNLIASQKRDETEAVRQHKDGRRMIVSIVQGPVTLSCGNVARYAIYNDITERKQVEQRLREYEKVVEGLDEMIVVVDQDYHYRLANRAFLTYRGLDRERVDRLTVGELLPPEVFDNMVKPKLDECFRENVVVKYEMQYNYPTIGERDLFVSYFPIEGPLGVERVACVLKDVTESKRAEEQLKHSEHLLAEARQLARIGSWNWDLRTNEVAWSDELYRIFGVKAQSFNPTYEKVIMEFIHLEDQTGVRDMMAKSLSSHEPFSYFYRILRPDGEERVIHSRGQTVSDELGAPIRVYGTAQDVTERRNAEEELRATSEQLRALSARVQSAKEEEATRIAREIHDELGAALSSLRWDLEEIDEVVTRSAKQPQLQWLREKIAAMMSLTDSTVNNVRRISSELRPITLDALGLSETIEWQARQFQERTGITVTCDCYPENVGLDKQQSTALFRILQEALTNILRHAQATEVHIQLSSKNDAISLTISDNGRGITEGEKSGQRTLGLLGMRERAHLIGGEMEITGTAAKGTIVVVRIPTTGPGR